MQAQAIIDRDLIMDCLVLETAPQPNPHTHKNMDTQTNTQNLIACTIKYIGPTDYRGSRIKMSLPRFDETLTIPYNYEATDAEEGAVMYLASNGCEPIARACGADHSVILLFSFDTTDSLLSLFRK
jgi:hypothetical protein